MREIATLTVGWLESSVRSVIAAGLLSRFQSVLITSIDSTTNLCDSTIGKRITALNAVTSCLGAGIVVRGHAIRRIAKSLDLFNGFDEVWCLDRVPELPKPADLWIVAPLNIENGPAPARLTSWMATTDCKLALGDGVGLNFATPCGEIAIQVDHLASR